ncbi:MAG: hypothetical protein KJO21_01475 [Verrucomicrobiae bacterium]|nr:hypothetical protein [Verrucomicrobiae bacterium]NNJ42205.1 hypothetical protein [Akkermansiaceae bacterium]
MKTLMRSAAVLTVLMAFAQLGFAAPKTEVTKTPALLAPYFTKDQAVPGEVGAIVPPKEINKYIAKVQASAKADPEWHAEYSQKAKPGIPLPWHDKLGLTKEEYDDYIKLWDQREFQAVQQVVIRLEEPKPGEWMIRVSGVGMPISLLRYNPEVDGFKSPNGLLKRIEDIDASARSILGAWAGQEWRYEQKTEFISTKENFALGKFKDAKQCLLIYRLQESTSGHRLADKSLVIRFSPPKK